MKILHITNNLWSGGVATYLIELLNFLSQNNEVTLLLLGEDEEEEIKNYFNTNIKIIFLNQKNLYSILSIFKIRDFIKNNEIIHVHLFPAQYIAIIANVFMGKKLIFTEHTVLNKRRNYKIFRLMEYFIYRKYEKIIAVSYDVKKSVLKWTKLNDKNEKVEVIENGINLDKYKDPRNIRKEIFNNLSEEDKLVCMIARFRPPKDYKTVVDAVCLLPEWIKCIFVGIGEEEEKIKKYVIERRKEKQIKFLGYRRDIADILYSSDLSILSSENEGFGLVILESLAVGTPILGSDVEGIKEIINSKKYLFKVKDPKDLAKQVLNILNENKTEKFNKYRKKVLKKYDITNFNKKYLEIYSRIKEINR